MRDDTPRDFDFLVLGSGIAGLFYALQVADHGRVAIVTKKQAALSATNFAQGGLAAVVSERDSLEQHVRDTLDAGAGLCREPVVRHVVERGARAVQALDELGVPFDRDAAGAYALGREGGHRARRVLHHRDATGRAIESALLAHARAHPNVQLLENHCAVELLTSRRAGAPGPNRALGAYVLDAERARTRRFRARITFLATGGAGKVYLYTSNPDIASGDGMAMAYRAGATLANMEFFQFHPTCLYHPDAKSFLISEAVRGEGARLRNAAGETFMDKTPDAELAPRDIVARAIDDELKRSGADSVFLDITHRDPDFVRARFPNIVARCRDFGLDPTRAPLPVVPAAHYCCGGVVTDLNGESDVRNLFAAGEVTCTGLHGANRLASNSLLEGVVFAEAAARESIARIAQEPLPAQVEIEPWREGDATESSEAVVITQNWDEIRRFMWNYVGIVRSDKRLARARRRIELLREEIRDYYWNFRLTPPLVELRNLALVAQLVIHCAETRRESRGLHYNLDHPQRDDRHHRRDTLLRAPV